MLGGTIPRPYEVRRDERRAAGSTRSATTRAYDYDPLWRAVRGARRRADVPLRRAGLGHPHVHRQQRLQPGRQLRRRRRGHVPVAGLRRRADAVPEAALRLPGRWRGVGGRAARRHRRPLGEAQRSRRSSSTTRPTSTATLLRQLFDEHATAAIAEPVGPARRSPRACCPIPTSSPQRRRQVRRVAAHRASTSCSTSFTNRFFFGCEADDPMNVLAFVAGLEPGRRHTARGVRLRHRPLGRARHARGASPRRTSWSSDGHIDEAQFRAFVFDNPVRLWAGANPDFFHGTVVESAVAKAVA